MSRMLQGCLKPHLNLVGDRFNATEGNAAVLEIWFEAEYTVLDILWSGSGSMSTVVWITETDFAASERR